MKKIKLTESKILGFIFCFFPIFLVAQTTQHYTLKSFESPKSEEVQITSGLNYLKLNTTDNILLAEANEFQQKTYSILDSAIIKNNGVMSYTVSEKKVSPLGPLTSLRELTIKFNSLIQRENNDPSNVVTVKLYIPEKYQRFCDYKFPTTIFLHHILNEVHVIEKASQLMASGLLNAHAAFAVIHMPYYGDRTDHSEQKKQFLTPNLDDFKTNVSQLILDTRMLKNILETLPDLDPNRMNLSGISLGGVLGLTVGAFDQSYNSYSFVVGGANFADILLNRAKTRPDSEVALALKGLSADENTVKQKLSAVDGYTWMHRYKNKSILMVNASKDDIVDYSTSVKPLVESISKNNVVKHQLNDDTHSPGGSVLTKYKNVFKPLVTFIVGDGPTLQSTCTKTNADF
jgi:hypothetical protein